MSHSIEEIFDHHWLNCIMNKLEENNNLFAEFEMTDNNVHIGETITYVNPLTSFKDIKKEQLMINIAKTMEKCYKGKQYYITTRGKNNSSHYYIVLSIIQN